MHQGCLCSKNWHTNANSIPDVKKTLWLKCGTFISMNMLDVLDAFNWMLQRSSKNGVCRRLLERSVNSNIAKTKIHVTLRYIKILDLFDFFVKIISWTRTIFAHAISSLLDLISRLIQQCIWKCNLFSDSKELLELNTVWFLLH